MYITKSQPWGHQQHMVMLAQILQNLHSDNGQHRETPIRIYLFMVAKAGLSNAAISNPTANLTSTTTYTVTRPVTARAVKHG